jgi:FixJ family two-component response regulator
VVAGKGNKEIARALRISHRTVEIHRSRVMRKMEAASVVTLAAMERACRDG